MHTWSGEKFWNEEWNRDIDFPAAFRSSCVWYFREVIDEIGADVMAEEQEKDGIAIYGKTGMGMAQGIVVDAWFTGFADAADKRIYFCVYLGETDDKNVSGAQAREIAVKIVSDHMDRPVAYI